MRMLNNLAFDRRLRRQMLRAGAVQRVAQVLLQQPASGGGVGAPAAAAGLPLAHGTAAAGSQLHPLALGLMYLVSMEAAGRQDIVTTDVLHRWGRAAPCRTARPPASGA